MRLLLPILLCVSSVFVQSSPTDSLPRIEPSAKSPTGNCFDGKAYFYDVNLRVNLGMPGVQPTGGGVMIAMKVKLAVSSHDTMALLKIMTCQFGTLPPGQHPKHSLLCSELVKHDLLFEYENGIVGKIFAKNNDLEEILNVKRGIISSFQVSPLPDGTHNIQETDVLGTCMVKVNSFTSGDTVIVSKERDTDVCSTHQLTSKFKRNLEQEAKFIYGSATSSYTFRPKGMFVNGEVSQRHYIAPLSRQGGELMSLFLLSLSLTEEKAEKCILLGVDTTLFREISIVFNHKANDVVVEDASCIDDVSAHLTALSDAPTKAVPKQFSQLIASMRQCSYTDLLSLTTSYVQCLNTSDVDHRRDLFNDIFSESRSCPKNHLFFLDALPFVHSEAALQLIRNLTTSECIGDSRYVWILGSLGQPSSSSLDACIMLDYVLDMARKSSDTTWTNRIMASFLAMGAVVDSVLSFPDSNCNDQVKMASDFLMSQLETFMTAIPDDFKLESGVVSEIKSWENAISTINAMGNAGLPSTILSLSKTIKERKLQTSGRIAAVNALKKAGLRDPLQVRRILPGLILDQHEEVEIRIAAFTVLMEAVEARHFFPMAMYREFLPRLMKDTEPSLKSFVCTYLLTLEQNKSPALRNLRYSARWTLRSLGYFYQCVAIAMTTAPFSSASASSYYSIADIPLLRSLPADTLGYDLSSSMIRAGPSWLPRAVRTKLSVNSFGYGIDLIELQGRATGLDCFIHRLFGPTGYFRKGTETMGPSGLKQEEFKGDLSELDLNVFASIGRFGNMQNWGHKEQDWVMEFLYNNTVLHSVRGFITEGKFGRIDFTDIYNLIKLARTSWNWWFYNENLPEVDLRILKAHQLGDVKLTIPTVVGLPIKASDDVTGYLNFELQISVIPQFKSWSEIAKDMIFNPRRVDVIKNVHISARTNPGLSLLEEIQVAVDAVDLKPGLVVRANATLDNIPDTVIDVYDGETLIYKSVLETTKGNTDLLEATYDQFFQMGNYSAQIGISKTNKTSLFVPGDVGLNLPVSEDMGVYLTTRLSYPNSTGVAWAPMFPLAGPASFSVALERPNSTAGDIIFVVENLTNIQRDYANITGTVSMVGTDRYIKSYLAWYNSEDQAKKVVDIGAVSHSGHMFGRFYGNRNNFLDIEGNLSVNTIFSNTTMHVKFNHTDFYGNLSYSRHTKFMHQALLPLPEKLELEAKGKLMNNTHGLLSATMRENGAKRPKWLRLHMTTKGLAVAVKGSTNVFGNFGSMLFLPFPIKSPSCHVLGSHRMTVITFDGMKHAYVPSPQCEYVLARHTHSSDRFAVTRLGDEVYVYINQTKYTLFPKGLKINNRVADLPYIEKHVVSVRPVMRHGYEYIHLSAWAGVDVYYLAGSVQLAVNGFYMTQTAGLCGNANYVRGHKDEMKKPNFATAESAEEFVESWKVQPTCSSPAAWTPVSKTPSSSTADLQLCTELLLDVLKDAHDHVGVLNFYDACQRDVSLGISPAASIRAYVLAAHAKEIDIDSCQYGPWSNWFICTNGEQSRQRELIKENVLGIECSRLSETRSCDVCRDVDHEKKRVFIFTGRGTKICRSVHHFLTCSDGCTPRIKKGDLHEFQCLTAEVFVSASAVNPFSFDNANPVWLPYNTVVECNQ